MFPVKSLVAKATFPGVKMTRVMALPKVMMRVVSPMGPIHQVSASSSEHTKGTHAFHLAIAMLKNCTNICSHRGVCIVCRWMGRVSVGLPLGMTSLAVGTPTYTITKNLHSALETLQKEISINRMAGRYKTLLCNNLRCSCLGVVPKKDRSWRLVNHLCAPAGDIIDYRPLLTTP